MKSSHCLSLLALGSVLLMSCGGSYADPLDGQQKKWECGDDPTPDVARTKFKALEDGLKKNLEALREARRTQNEQAQNICLDNIERAAEHKASLTATMNG